MTKVRGALVALSILSLLCTGVSCSNSGNGRDQGATIQLSGSGASFPAPLYSKWFKAFNKLHPNVQIDYQSIGSGGGKTNVIQKKVDFGASDAAMSPEEMAKVDVGVQLLPMTAGSIVLAYNLEGVDNLKLSRSAYVDIFLGKVKKWNSPEIAKTNPGATLPDSEINVVVRADGSGTSYVFSQHMSAISEEFKKSPGTNTQPNWPVGTKAAKNDGVAAAITKSAGSIGYMEYGFAKLNKIKMASLENKAGKFVEPTISSGQAALAGAKLPEDLIAWVPDPDGDTSYPIVTYTWIICYKKYEDAKKVAALKEVLTYSLTDGQKESEAMGYIPLPGSVVEKVKAAMANISAGSEKAGT
jgi:phosphate transport system substrate-binding protein